MATNLFAIPEASISSPIESLDSMTTNFLHTHIHIASSTRNLQSDLFKNYERSLAPVHVGAPNDTFVENFTMMITYPKLTSVNERGMEFSIVMGMMLMWTDPRMRWNPLKYNNISHFYLTLDQIWFPHFHPCTSSAVTYLSIDRNQAVKIFSNGEVKTILRAEITFSCAFNTERFPFDVQQCYLCFTLNGYDPEEVRFTAYMDEGALTNEMSEWRVQIDNKTFSFPYCANDICMTIMQYPVVLSRNPQFWIGLVVIPIGFGLTTMTSMMVVVGILNDSLSKIERIPCMGLFVLIQISVTSIAVISVLLTDQIVRKLSKMAKSKSRDNSRVWRVVEKVSSGGIVRNTLFIVFTILHIANFIWFVSNKQEFEPKNSSKNSP